MSVRVTLAGRWRFGMNAPDPAIPQAAELPEMMFAETIRLPGTTETNRKGPKNPAREKERLTRVRHFDGPAWYQRAIRIPGAWRGKKVRLFLERTKYTQVWLDGKAVGAQALYCVPQIYELGTVAPGKHTLTVMVDNRLDRIAARGWDAHQHSDNTQTNWNGILGRMELLAVEPVRIEDAQVYPDVARRSALIRVTIGNATGRPVAGTLDLVAESWNHDGAPHVPPPVRHPFSADGAITTVEITYPLGVEARLWDEFSPDLYRLAVSSNAAGVRDLRAVDFGLREFSHRDGQFTINGRTTFLRGKHDGCVFPLTGHPPMDVEGWMNYLLVCKDYGINHIRCHTWTPPEAALAAADRLGIYFQSELPFWGPFTQAIHDGLMPEAERILRDYGNHPSFTMMTLGNELGGERPLMENIVRALRALDPRRLYACGSNNHHADPRLSPSDDFWSTMYTRLPAGGDRMPVRGSFYDGDGGGIVQKSPPNTRRDYRASLAGIPVPVIGHEIAQYSMYPDYTEIPKYTGVVQARNLEMFRDALEAAGMSDQAEAFMRASGILSALCYREEIEMALRTPGFAGFQLLDLQDFPGQGTALVGVLNAFMESKGLIAPPAWRQFCGPVVPLARFDKFTWTVAEDFSADIEVAHYGEHTLSPAVLRWTLRDACGATLAGGELCANRLEQGGLRRMGAIRVPLSKVASPARLTLDLALSGTAVANAYAIWVYPEQEFPPEEAQGQPVVSTGRRAAACGTTGCTGPTGVTIARALDAATREVLGKGGSVLLIPEAGKISHTVGGGFAPDFWCWKFRNKPGTLGLLCDPEHPALAGFPTAFHGDWQWFYLTIAGSPVILDESPADFHPIVQTIDNIARHHKLGLIFECRALGGRLLVCATDLLAMRDRPEARQLLKSLTDYAGSERFNPMVDCPNAQIHEFTNLASSIPASPPYAP